MLICTYRFDYCGREKYRSLSFWALFIIFVAVSGLRYRIGTDSTNYESVFEMWPTIGELAHYRFDYTRYEPGFIVLASIPRSLSADFMVFQFFEALVVCSVIFWFASKNCRHVFLCLTFFFLFQYLNFLTEIMREAIAVSLFLCAWPSFRDGRWWLYFTICLGVFMIHTSGVITFLLPIMCIKGVRELFYFGRRTIIIGALVIGGGYIVQLYFYDVFRMLAFTDRMMDRAQIYSEEELSGQLLNIMGIIGAFFRFVFYPLLALIFYRKKLRHMDNEERKKHRKMEMMVVAALYINLLSIPVFIFSRFNNYLCMFTFAFVANWVFSTLPVNGKKYKLKPAYWALLFVPMFFFQIYTYFNNVNKSGTLKVYMTYYPYVSRLNPYMDQQREEVFRYIGRK